MANANWSNPQLTSTYTNFVTEVKARDEDLAKQFDGFTGSNQVTGTIRWDSSANRWKKWTGSAWGELTATYALTALTTTGTASFGGNTTVTGTLDVSSTITGTSFIPDGTTAPANGIYLQSANVLGLAAGSAGRVFIKSSTGVGIGETNPGKKLDVAGGIRVAAGNDFDGDVGYTFRSGGDTDGGLFSNADGKLILATNNASRLTINGSNIGVGTESPGALLHLNIGSASGVDLRFQNTEGVGDIVHDGDSFEYKADGHLFKTQSGSTIVKIDTANTRLGIGTTSPTQTLDVNGTAKATTFSGSGASLTSLNGSNISSGTVAAARVATLNQSTTGNAATATQLATARNIGGVSFNGTTNINLPGVNAAGNQSTSGNAATATTATDLSINATNKLLYQASNNNSATLAAGTSGQYLRSNGSSAPSWQNIDSATYLSHSSVIDTTARTFSTNTWTDVGLSITYTPQSSSSTIILAAYLNLYCRAQDQTSSLQWSRFFQQFIVTPSGGSASTVQEKQKFHPGASHQWGGNSSYGAVLETKFHFYEEFSNSDTTQKVFKVQLREENGTLLMNKSQQNNSSGKSYFTLMEVL